MPDALLGVSTRREIYFESQGAPVEGASLLFGWVSPTNVPLITGGAPTEEGDGWYSYYLDGSENVSESGAYTEQWIGHAADGTDLRYYGQVLVLPAGRQLLTRRELRFQLAHELGDIWLGQVTGATLNSLSDLLYRTAEPNTHWAGFWLHVYSGTGRLQERRVSTFSQATGTFAVPKWVTTPGVGARYELHKRWSVAEYNAALDRAIYDVARTRALVTVRNTTLTQAPQQFEYPVPAGFVTLASVESGSDAQGWTWLWPETDWRVLPGQGLWIVNPQPGQALRLIGQIAPSQLARDDSFADVDAAYLVHGAAAHLLGGKIAPPQDPDATAAALAYHKQLADDYRPRGNLLKNAVKVA